VLVVDDDESYRDALASGLKAEGFLVATATSGRTAMLQFAGFNPDAVVLDQRLPDMPGTEVCRAIREISDVPVLMLSAVAEEVDVILSFELGADDYIAKPLRLRELVARLNAAIRLRAQARMPESPMVVPRDDLVLGPLLVSFDSRIVELNGERVELARKEFDLLAELASRPGRVFTREELMDAIWGIETADDRTLDTHMYRLRTKLERDPQHPEFIVTVRGVGYLLNDRVREPRDEGATKPS